MLNTPLRFAFIKAGWHSDIVDRSLDGFRSRLSALGRTAEITVVDVPGAFEMPLKAQALSRTGRFDAIICTAFVVDGGIYRHEFVAQAVVSGLMQVQLETGTPVLSVSLTPHNFQPTEEHRNFFREHFVTKGAEAADAAISIAGEQTERDMIPARRSA